LRSTSGHLVGVSYLLPRLIGASRAFEMILSGREIGAVEAERAGLVSRVYPNDELLPAALEARLARARRHGRGGGNRRRQALGFWGLRFVVCGNARLQR